MKRTEEHINDILDRYLDGKITKEQVRLLHEKLQRGEPLYEETEEVGVQEHPDLFDPRQMDDPLDFSSTIESIRHSRHLSNARRYALASLVFFGVLLVAPFIYLLLMPVNKFQASGLFYQYFEPMPLLEKDADCGGFAGKPDAFDVCGRFVVNYADGKYEEAFKYLTGLLAAKPGNAESLHLYLANALLAADKPSEALLHLKHPELLNGELRHQALWYKALAYLKLGDVEQSRANLKQLHNENAAFNRSESVRLGDLLNVQY